MAGESARDQARIQHEKAGRHKRVAERYERGARGEAATAQALDPLAAQGWVVRHDLVWPARPRANIDHVAIGPGGVFVIDSKNWSGDIVVRDEVLRQNGYSRASTVKAVSEAADAVSSAIGGVPVTGVLCFTGDRGLAETVEGVLICSTDNVVELLVSQPLTLHSEAVDRFVRRSVITLPPATGPRATKARTARSAGDRAVSRGPVLRHRTNRRLRSVLVRGGIGLAIIGAFAFTGPRIAPTLTDLFTRGLGAEVVKVGDSVDVAGVGKRPDLSVTVVSVKKMTKAGGESAKSSQLLAVRIRFENTGSTAWKARSAAHVSIVTTDGRTVDADPRRSTRAGGAEFPGKPRVRPGKSFAGRAIVLIPKDSRAKSVRVTLDGASGTFRWDV